MRSDLYGARALRTGLLTLLATWAASAALGAPLVDTASALLQGGVAGKGWPAPDGAYAGVTERRTEWGLAAASMRLSTTAPMATSVR
jgi:hypothetical protein